MKLWGWHLHRHPAEDEQAAASTSSSQVTDLLAEAEERREVVTELSNQLNRRLKENHLIDDLRHALRGDE